MTGFLYFYILEEVSFSSSQISFLMPGSHIINRLGVARPILQTPLLLTDSLIIKSMIFCENIVNKPSLQNQKRYRTEILSEGLPPPTCHISCVTCHMLCVTSHLFNFFYWLPCLVSMNLFHFLPNVMKTLKKR